MLLVAGAVAGEVTVRNISMLSKQADTAVCTALVRAGAAVINEADSVTAISRPLHGFEFDATGSSTRRATAPRRSAKNTPK